MSFSKTARIWLLHSGLVETSLLSSSSDEQSFGNAEAVFEVGGFLLRFVGDRSQTFIDIASSLEPIKFYQFDDFEIAMGWRTIDQVLAKREPEPVDDVLKRIKNNQFEISAALSGEQGRFTRARIERAARDRGQAFTAALQRKK